ncbi:DEAD/DEAH box helicase [Candidatus Gracilibacteria bacterium 28_42_T64]|nr:DEAD/DEAH box helicase [Candidatus Gracilibacteria bacterium 28_42_T64]
MYCIVSPFSKTFDEIGLIYFVPDFLSNHLVVGNIVEIPLKSQIEVAVVLNTEVELGDIETSKIKSLISIKNSDIFFQKYHKELILWIAKYYFTPIHNSLSIFFPRNLREKIIKDKIEINKPGNNYSYTYNHNLVLSEPQNKAFTEVKTVSNKKVLLYGLTGSGKTEIYIKLIKETIDGGAQALLLIPEIILTNQISEKISKVFGDQVLIINSTVTDATKTKYWIDIYNGNAKIIIGTRSALFYPYKNLDLIIIDEEHDNSYVSDSSPRYNAIEVANKISDLTGAKLLLASGTPSIKNMYQALKGKYKLVSLLERYGEK